MGNMILIKKVFKRIYTYMLINELNIKFDMMIFIRLF